ncbi:MAG: tRNA (N(6)-L-threonylcarbamoyladenosine(37)-C(2))-methylthiotransferase MtaB [Victivallales bacterium]|nr:tRNA (N(6)-L-threonylcarbamoyladenosine(37)-C(2))-methylthiotransferase MtaB [Victivallales bacterium]
MMSAFAATLGCRLNQADTALIISRLESAGFSAVSPESTSSDDDSVYYSAPDIVVVNTCTVTANAARKSRQTARKLRKRYPDAFIVITGCDCESDEGFWEQEASVDLTVPNTMKPRLVEILLSRLEELKKGKSNKSPFLASFRKKPCDSEILQASVFKENALATFPFLTKAYLKVQEGCDAFCSYCIVPHVRGRERSRKHTEVLEEAEKLIADGHSELVLTGVNISTYDDGGMRIAELAHRLADLTGEFRIRFSSMEPNDENLKLVKLMRDNRKICRFLHVPLQHGTDEILEAMGRPEESAKFADFISWAALEVPGIHLGTDIIAGFPGETDELFEKSYDLLSKLPLANIHVFAFSPRKGTPAAEFPDQIPKRIAKTHADRLKRLSKTLAARFAESQKDEPASVLLEKEISPGIFEGWSDNYIRTTVKVPNACSGELFTSPPL